jgi:hypothetical protein
MQITYNLDADDYIRYANALTSADLDVGRRTILGLLAGGGRQTRREARLAGTIIRMLESRTDKSRSRIERDSVVGVFE